MSPKGCRFESCGAHIFGCSFQFFAILAGVLISRSWPGPTSVSRPPTGITPMITVQHDPSTQAPYWWYPFSGNHVHTRSGGTRSSRLF
ncbi:hypothetical protein BDN72DRAFT_628250 [Pluteus cervinus]|uniref:Uncharacterized protein n=1 Tax=Pluteus cervinus TaxID=181527 RepID=A0ACD3A1J4_9AGAR|nr:hypothetical protein BDN72DRAFT_628250 [Pluteus cervinus]